MGLPLAGHLVRKGFTVVVNDIDEGKRKDVEKTGAGWEASARAFAQRSEFVLVCVGVPILRYTNPNAQRPFKVPFGPYLLPLLGAASCIFLMYYLPPASWWRFVGWLVLGFAIYSAYGYTRSTIGQEMGRPRITPWTLKVASLGFLLTAGGLFTIPHDAGLGTLIAQAGNAAGADHGRSLLGLSLIVLGLVLGTAGLLIETGDRRRA